MAFKVVRCALELDTVLEYNPIGSVGLQLQQREGFGELQLVNEQHFKVSVCLVPLGGSHNL